MGKQKTNETKIATLWGGKKSVAKTSARPTKKREKRQQLAKSVKRELHCRL